MLSTGFICSNYYAFPAFARLLHDPRVRPTWAVGLDEARFASSGMRPFYYQGSRFFAYALGHGVRSHLTHDLNEDESLRAELARDRPEVILAMGWPDILTPASLSLASQGVVGIHPSSLPDYRGGAPLNWQLLDGRSRLGVTSFLFAERVDAGEIIVQHEFAISEGNACTLIEDVYEQAFYDVLDATLDVLVSGRPSTPVDPDAGFYRRRRTPEDGRLDFAASAGEVVRFVTAQTFPFPGAFFDWRDTRFVCNSAVIASGAASPGRVLEVAHDLLVVACGDGAVTLTGIVVQGAAALPVPGDDLAQL